MTKETISHKFSTVEFFGTDTDTLLDVDTEASIERYAELLVRDIAAEYPDAKIEVEWTHEAMPGTKTFIAPWEYLTPGYDDVMDDIQRIREDLYGAFERWIVDGFGTEAWMSKIERDADRAYTGDVLVVTVGEAGPMETQDAMVEIVVLSGGQGQKSDVAFRYSTHSQDEDWQLGTVKDAVEYAAECYRRIKDAERKTV